jgi:hypothetical protein
MTKSITIKDGWYWSAGHTYGWTSEYHPEGVGLNRDLFDSDTIIVTVLNKSGNGTKYELDSKKGLEFIRSHHAFKTIGTVKVGFIPRELMKEI